MASLVEKNSSLRDVMKVKIGNIPPQKNIKIKFSYLEELQIF